MNTLKHHAENASSMDLNEISLVSITLNEKIVIDDYQSLPGTGSFILIDRVSNGTVGAGMILEAIDEQFKESKRDYSTAERALNLYIRENFPEWGCLEI
ncbi:hypothetical protein K6U52_20205 [Vibrio vulnificus]|nr:hypothetical protein [Vibrio vulnificus]MCG6315565.1 hypothetical protein [Vibrio vulnificus]